MLYRLSSVDAVTYERMEDKGASQYQLSEFYTVSRRQERNRIAAHMSHQDRERFQYLLAHEASHNVSLWPIHGVSVFERNGPCGL